MCAFLQHSKEQNRHIRHTKHTSKLRTVDREPVCACVRAGVRACVRACVRVCVSLSSGLFCSHPVKNNGGSLYTIIIKFSQRTKVRAGKWQENKTVVKIK